LGLPRPRHDPVDERPDLPVDQHRVPGRQPVPGALDEQQLGAGQLGQPLADRVRAHLVLGAVDGQHRAADVGAQRLDRRADRAVAAEPAGRRGGQHLGLDVQRPADAVLDLLGRVRLGEHRVHEEPDEVRVAAAEPVVLVVLPPALVAAVRFAPDVPVPLRLGDPEAARGAQRHDPLHPVRVRGGDPDRPGHAAGEADEHGPVHAGVVEHGDGVGRVLLVGVRGGLERAAGPAAAAAVEGDHPEVPGQVGHLGLPDPGVDDRPGRHQHDRGLGRAVARPREGDAVTDGDPLAVGESG
jgi:hypothetical protein